MAPLYNFIVYLVWFLSTYFVVTIILAMFIFKEKLFEKRKRMNSFPLVSVLVPAFNEATKIADTIASLKKITYPAIEYIIINDGSTDKTSSVAAAAIGKDPRFIFIDRKDNRGKASSLNEGIARAKGECIACMDADSIVQPTIFQKTIPLFKEPLVGAVTVTVQLRKPKTFLHKIIDIEYTIGLSLFLKLFSFFNCIFVTPGPFSVYRKKMLDQIGGFDVTNITEDHEIAYRIHKAGYRIENCFEAKVYTISPATFKGVYVQRRRWYSGAIHTFFQHTDTIRNKKLGLFRYATPFNFLLISSGMMLFYASTYMGISKFLNKLWQYQYTGFNFFKDFFDFNIDLFATSQISLVGFCAFFFTLFIMFSGLWLTRKKVGAKKIGMLGFPFMFFLYQIFWTGAILAALRKKRVKWR